MGTKKSVFLSFTVRFYGMRYTLSYDYARDPETFTVFRSVFLRFASRVWQPLDITAWYALFALLRESLKATKKDNPETRQHCTYRLEAHQEQIFL